ncbi:MAG TPA: peptidyl-prolyl cis-trans isomerase [Terriglobia bacterium]|nr:peptidyl-prolyl cis-trans isomerase [Terriglobia bacterium]
MYRFFRGKNRQKLMKYLLIFFLGIVSLGMVVMLSPLSSSDTTTANSNVLATLGNFQISTQDLQRRVDQQFGNSAFRNNPELMARFAPNVLDAMLQDQAVVAEAGRLGLQVSNQELAEAIRSYPGLSNNGNFIGYDQYQNAIETQTGMTVAQFEAQLRDGLLSDKLRNVVTDAVQVTPADVHQEFVQRNEKARIDYVLFDPTQFTKDVQVTPEALQAYFKSNRDRYKLPEERSLRYVLIDADHVRALVKVSDDELRAAYAQHIAEYRVPDRVKVSQIFFKTGDQSPSDIAKARQQAQSVLDELHKGGDFAALAKKSSEDSSASNGGDLGWIGRGQTDFDSEAFSLPPGQVSGLITTASGIHIIKVSDKQTAHVQTFDEVKETIRAALEKQKLDDAQNKLANQVEDAARADPQHFDAVAAKAGLTTQETPLFKFNEAIPNLGTSEGLKNLGFQLTAGEVGQPVTVPKGIVIIQLAKVTPAHNATLDEVRAQAEQDYRNDQAKVLAAEKAKELSDKAKTGDFKKIAQSMGLTVKESKDFTRQDTVDTLISATELGDAFTLKPGQASGVVPVSANSIVFQVVSHTPADESAFAAQQEQIRQQVLDQQKAFAWEVYRQNLKKELQRDGKLKINQDALKQLVASYNRS